MADLKRTPLYDLHLEQGAKMVPFAGYEMPVQFAPGVLKEHLHCRARAGLFDVSHMGQVAVRPRSGDYADAARALETLVPVDVLGLGARRQRYGMFTTEEGGIADDLMLANLGDRIFVVLNAARKADDIAHLQARLGESCRIEAIADRALLALQGPEAEAVLSRLAPAAAGMKFMDVAELDLGGAACVVSRSGYTGEDGYEISVPEGDAEALARALLAHDAVTPVGLGARDSLRLEAGLCLHGADIDATTSPVEAGLAWAIGKVRRRGGDREGGFPGAARILGEIADGPDRLRVGVAPEGRAPARAGCALYDAETADAPVGAVTSGGYGPAVEAPISMGYVPAAIANAGMPLWAEVRGRRLPARIVGLPFRAATYKR